MSFTIIIQNVLYLDINECSEDNACHPNATCVNEIGSYDCNCNEGFEGEGQNCEGKKLHF